MALRDRELTSRCPATMPARRRFRLPLGALGVAAPLLLGGLLPLGEDLNSRWGWAGAWQFPVGDAWNLAGTPADERFKLLRGLGSRRDSTRPHQGADLGNGRGGDPVRAAAIGIVVRVAQKGYRNGFGSHVVLGHRVAGSPPVYSVYAHLEPGSIVVREGDLVAAGRVLGRVGRSGRASTAHLHFELRLAGEPGERWEKARAVDPLAWVRARLPVHRADTTWAAPYLAWGEAADLAPGSADPGRSLRRGAWQAMLARAARHELESLPGRPEALRGALIEAGVLPEDERAPLEGAVSWRELARDLARLDDVGHRLTRLACDPARHRALCDLRLGLESPAGQLRKLGARKGPAPSLAEALMILADLAGAESPSGARPVSSR